ncbi:MAG: SH3 domain-containing protein, partial [Pyrinomonadaceae bacterium]
MFRNSRQIILVLIVVTSFLAASFAASAESWENSKKPAIPTPAPKKSAKATPTPSKKAQVKSTPKAKKSAVTTAKSKIADKKSATAKNDSKNKNSKEKDKNRKETSRNTKDVKSAAKKSAASKSKERIKAKTDSRIKNSKSASKTRNSKSASAAKNSSVEQIETSKKVKAKPAAKPKPKAEETTSIADAPQVVVTDVSAQIRSLARANAPELGKVKLGTVLNVSQKTQSWYKVQFSNGAKPVVGWIPASAVGSLDAANKPQIYAQVANRYSKPNMDFATSSALYEFLTRSRNDFENSDSAADLELKRLLALHSALEAIPAGGKDIAPYNDFLKARDKEIVYSEPSGKYIVVSNLFWDLHKKYKDSPLADQIAWEAAQNPLPGECEGYVNCHLFYARM